MRLVTPAIALAALAAGLLAGSVTPAPAGAQVAGVQVHPLWSGVGEAEARREIDAAADAGARMIRVDVGWASLEQERKGRPETWYLRRLDAVVDHAATRGVRVLLTLMSSPCWASSAPDDVRQGCAGSWWERDVQHYAPRDPADYGDALAFLVRRYGGRVAAWEVWNEPNQDAFFRAGDQAKAYAALLRAAYAAAKRADPAAVVVGGSLAEADAEFTERLYGHGVKGSFDAWSIHPYSGDRGPLDAQAGGFSRGVPAVRDVMMRHGDDKPLWLTEFGWTTSTFRDGEPWENGVDPERQAAYLEQAFAALEGLPYVDVAIWFNLRDTSGDPADRVGNYGLLRDDWSPKPAHAAFRRAAAQLDHRPAGASAPGRTDTATATTTGTGTGTTTATVARTTLSLRRRRRGRLLAFGTAPPASRLEVSVWSRRGRPRVLRRVVRAGRHGRFRTKLAVGRAARRRWRAAVVARCAAGDCAVPPRASATLAGLPRRGRRR